MTTTRPRPPSVHSEIIADALVPLHHSEALYYLVGPRGTGSTESFAANARPSAVVNSLADAERFIGSDGPLHVAAEAIFDQVDTNMAIALTPPGPTAQQTVDALEKVRFLTDRPTHLYAPGQTPLGAVMGTLGAAMGGGSTALTLVANATAALNEEDLLRIDDEIVRITTVTNQRTFVVARAQHGTVAASHLGGARVTDLHSPVCTELRQLVDELECVAVADAPHMSVAAARQWAEAGNLGPDLMGVFNRGDSKWPGGFWLGATADVAAEHGRARGIEHARVHGISSLEHDLSHSPREAVETDVSNLVGSYLSTLVRRRGHIEIVGHTFRGVDDVRKFWSVSLVVQHLRRIAEETAEPFIGDDTTQEVIVDLAGKVERAGRQLTRGIRRELRFFSCVPHPTLNTPETRANGVAHLLGVAHTITPIGRIEIPIRLELA